MEERVTFIARFLEGEKVTRLAEEFGISRKMAYKIFERYQDTGLEGPTASPSTAQCQGRLPVRPNSGARRFHCHMATPETSRPIATTRAAVVAAAFSIRGENRKVPR